MRWVQKFVQDSSGCYLWVDGMSITDEALLQAYKIDPMLRLAVDNCGDMGVMVGRA